MVSSNANFTLRKRSFATYLGKNWIRLNGLNWRYHWSHICVRIRPVSRFSRVEILVNGEVRIENYVSQIPYFSAVEQGMWLNLGSPNIAISNKSGRTRFEDCTMDYKLYPYLLTNYQVKKEMTSSGEPSLAPSASPASVSTQLTISLSISVSLIQLCLMFVKYSPVFLM